MSGIFGLIHLDGSPVVPDHLTAMRNAMAHWGPDGVRSWREGEAGLGHCLLFNTSEAVYERVPYATADRLAFTAEARLDNRDELFAALGLHNADRAEMPDGDLIFRAYEKWGDESPNHLLGDWSFAVWDVRARKLFLARDHSGVTSLYYFHDGRRFAFASDRRALLALPNVPRRLNELYLAQVLVAWKPGHGETIFLDVHRLSPAHAMTVSAEHMRAWRFWRLEDAPDVRLATAADYADGLRDELARAVRCRTRSLRRVAISLSGGLDSGSVAVLAAQELAITGRDLLALTSVPVHESPDTVGGRIANEFSYAAAAVKFAHNVEHVPVTAHGISPAAGIERTLQVHGEPWRYTCNQYWLIALHEAARERRAGALLTGSLGNGTISWHGHPALSNVAVALGRGGFGEAAREAMAWVKSTPPSRLYQRWRLGQFGQSASQPWRDYSPIHPAFAERIQLRDRMASAGHDPAFGSRDAGNRGARYEALRTSIERLGIAFAELAAAEGLEGRDPTSDARLLSFVFGIPNRFWRGPINRWLIRDAMKGLLPDEVRLCRQRGRQAADIVPRILDHVTETDRMLKEIAASPLAREYVDVDYLYAVDRRMRKRNDRSTRAAADTVLLPGLAAGVFVARWTESNG